jgi:hypothetical protein
MIYSCCDERRRELVRDHGVVKGVDYNGIDFLEVVDADAPSQAERQRTLFVHFLKKVAGLTKDNIVIAGGERIRGIAVQSATIGTGAESNILTVNVDRAGDFSTYTLRIVKDALHAAAGGGEPPDGFDPVLSSIDFSFRVECPSDFDCKTTQVCPPIEHPAIDIDYLAKDYNSFRQVMLDRMSALVPRWQERNAADAGIALVELLAYAADHLSYQQDVIATEAYLDTARRRVSVRRHATLIDYAMHDGCNARTWVQVTTDYDGVVLKRGTQLLTRVAGVKPVVDGAVDGDAVRKITEAVPEAFETIDDATLYVAHDEIELYTWQEERCCLPAGATRATLKGDFTAHLGAGDVLVFEEKVGPETGEEADADPANRHAVRLTSAASSRDPLVLLADGKTPQPLTEIEWNGEDALPFALCISSRTKKGYKPKVSVALGNIVLADHGKTISEPLGLVPNAQPALATVASRGGGDRCQEREPQSVLPRFNPRLKESPLTQAVPRPFAADPGASASSVFRWEMRDVLPAITLGDTNGQAWAPQRDLLSSDAFAAEFVAEVEEDGRGTLRFGDDKYGLRPTPGTTLTATYRIGNGIQGNVGAGSIAHILTADTRITGVRNPMPARGGTEPESLDHVRRSAPSAFRVQERAVTAGDYAEVAQRHPEVQRAASTVRWTGSWRTIFLSVDRFGGGSVDAAFERKLRQFLERYRMAGHDLEIDGPQFVPLEIEMTVCVKPQYFRGDVEAELLRIFSNSVAPDGRRGFFHADNFSFGQPVYLSAIYAAAQKVEGVRFVTIVTFQRLGLASKRALDDGVLGVGRLEIARLDNDPNFAERGVLRLNMEGGK